MTSHPDFKDFMRRLKHMEPFEKCDVEVEFVKIEEQLEEDSVQDSNNTWKSIDENSILRNGEQINVFKNLSQILYTIFKTRFLIPISDIKIDYQSITRGSTSQFIGKILITDDYSRVILNDIIDLKSMKAEPIGICCEYSIRDILPEELKRRYHLIYFICLNEMSDEEFDLLYNSLQTKESSSQTVFSFYILLNSQKRVKKLHRLRQTSIISGYFQMGGFQWIDYNMVVIDSNLNMNWLSEKKNTDFETERLVRSLVNFLEQIGEFPTVFRYHKSSHKINKTIADRVLQEMLEIADLRKGSNEKKHENNYQLLIINRSIDLITPLIHCSEFRPFVFNELENQYENDMNTEYRKLNKISVDNTLEIKKTFDKLRELFKDNESKYEILIKKFNKNIENASAVFNKIKISSYSQLLSIEKSLLEKKSCLKSEKSLQKIFNKLISRTDTEVSNYDLSRVLMISNLFNKNETKEDIKQYVKQNQKERQIDWTVVEDFVELKKTFVNTKKYSSTESNISQIVTNFFKGSLSEETYPLVYKKIVKDTQRQKLILFILGGLSYNDLVSIPEEYQKDVIFCANGLITPKMFINSFICE